MRDSRYSREAVLAGRRYARSRRRTALAALALTGALVVGGTAAFLFTDADPVENAFTPSSVTTYVDEDTSNGVKSNVQIKNTGNTAAYVRAAVIVTWQDAFGNVYGQAPVSNLEDPASYDYEVSYELDGGWFKGPEGFYYWEDPVDPEDSTGVLISECGYNEDAEAPTYKANYVDTDGDGSYGEGTDELVPLGDVRATSPDDILEIEYGLNVEILGSGIQAKGETTSGEVQSGPYSGEHPVEIAWGVSLDSGTKKISNA